MKNAIRSRALVALCAAVLAPVTGFAAYRAIVVRADVIEGLEGISIMRPADAGKSLHAGESLTLTAEGDYGTSTMPVKASWSIREGKTLGTLGECTRSKTCVFTALDGAGEVVIEAEASGKTATATITVEKKEEELVNPFKDELPAWASEAIIRMYRKSIVKGYDDGRYGPGDPVTNGQIVTLLFRILRDRNLVTEPADCGQKYDDVPGGHYAFTPACLFGRQGWAQDAAAFRPDDPATRGSVASFIDHVFGKTLTSALGREPQAGVQTFDDVPATHPQFRSIAVANAMGVMTGYPNGDFGVNDPFNRAAAAVVMFRILTTLEERTVSALAGYDLAAGAPERPAASSASVSSQEPVASSEPASSEASGVSPESISSQEPAVSSEPVPTIPSSASEEPVSSQGPAAPVAPLHTGPRVQLSDTKATNFDFSEGVARAEARVAYDMTFLLQKPDWSARKVIVFAYGNDGTAQRQSLVALSPKPYAQTEQGDCETALRARGVFDTKTLTITSHEQAVCFRTYEGHSGKVGDLVAQDYTLGYEFWEAARVSSVPASQAPALSSAVSAAPVAASSIASVQSIPQSTAASSVPSSVSAAPVAASSVPSSIVSSQQQTAAAVTAAITLQKPVTFIDVGTRMSSTVHSGAHDVKIEITQRTTYERRCSRRSFGRTSCSSYPVTTTASSLTPAGAGTQVISFTGKTYEQITKADCEAKIAGGMWLAVANVHTGLVVCAKTPDGIAKFGKGTASRIEFTLWK